MLNIISTNNIQHYIYVYFLNRRIRTRTIRRVVISARNPRLKCFFSHGHPGKHFNITDLRCFFFAIHSLYRKFDVTPDNQANNKIMILHVYQPLLSDIRAIRNAVNNY